MSYPLTWSEESTESPIRLIPNDRRASSAIVLHAFTVNRVSFALQHHQGAKFLAADLAQSDLDAESQCGMKIKGTRQQ